MFVKLRNQSCDFSIYMSNIFVLTILIFHFPIETMCHLGVIVVFLMGWPWVMVNGNSPPTIYHNQLWLSSNITNYKQMCPFDYVPTATYPTTSLLHCLGLATAHLASADAACYDSSAANQANQRMCSLWGTGLSSNLTNELLSLGLTGNPKCMINSSPVNSRGQWLKTTLFLFILLYITNYIIKNSVFYRPSVRLSVCPSQQFIN